MKRRPAPRCVAPVVPLTPRRPRRAAHAASPPSCRSQTEALAELLESDDKFGFIVMDGNGSLYGTVAGNTREILHKFSVDLPKKHGRGGQSALRFARLRLERRHNYVTKVGETATQMFITNDKVRAAPRRAAP